ncbi:unnamed protein product [Schistocephalus solidus]|uniref:Actin-related protein 2/3 complex subunit n=1 Tax=Schistocephalus solidus TaxID=70667 RepID=A0A183SJJ2_SCHSO|nr:unnamed protein product [Schistocephalus solidus]
MQVPAYSSGKISVMATPHWIGNDALVAHAFNKDASLMAISINTNNVYILSVPRSSSEKFQLKDILKEHSSLVTGLDWCPISNQIVSCSADRNAYVWKQNQEGKWKPTLVALQMNRAALCVRWSPLGNKFAVGAGSKLISICFFEKEQDWWVPKHIKKQIKSSVTCLDWHPNNLLIACGSTDYRVRVFSAFVKQVDDAEADSSWGAKSPFQTCLYEFYGGHGGWIHSLAFSADGCKLAWVSHDSKVSIADTKAADGNPAVVTSLEHKYLPFASCIWIGPNSILAAGHDCAPIVFNYKGPGGGISEGTQIDTKSASQPTNKLSAMRKFQDIDRMATTDNTGSRLATIHQNSIKYVFIPPVYWTCCELRIFKGDRNKAVQTTSIGQDGQLVIWDLVSLSSQISGLSIN